MTRQEEMFEIIKDFCAGFDYYVNEFAQAVKFEVDTSQVDCPGIDENTTIVVYVSVYEEILEVMANVEGMDIISHRKNALLNFLNKLNSNGLSTFYINDNNWFGVRDKLDCKRNGLTFEDVDDVVNNVVDALLEMLDYVDMINNSVLGADQAYKQMIKDGNV